MSSPYVEVQLTLDSFDLNQIQLLISNRIDELNEIKAQHSDAPNGIVVAIMDEQLHNYQVTLDKIEEAREDVKRVKAEADAAYAAEMANRTKSRS